MNTTTLETTVFHPIAPRRSEDTGLSRVFISNLILKTFYYRSEMRGFEVAKARPHWTPPWKPRPRIGRE